MLNRGLDGKMESSPPECCSLSKILPVKKIEKKEMIERAEETFFMSIASQASLGAIFQFERNEHLCGLKTFDLGLPVAEQAKEEA